MKPLHKQVIFSSRHMVGIPEFRNLAQKRTGIFRKWMPWRDTVNDDTRYESQIKERVRKKYRYLNGAVNMWYQGGGRKAWDHYEKQEMYEHQ